MHRKSHLPTTFTLAAVAACLAVHTAVAQDARRDPVPPRTADTPTVVTAHKSILPAASPLSDRRQSALKAGHTRPAGSMLDFKAPAHPQQRRATGAPACALEDPASCQLPDQDGHGAGGITGSTSDVTAGFLTYDNFRPTVSGSITSTCWWGFYLDFDVLEDCGAGATDSFEISYYADDGGVPGVLLLSEVVVAARTATGNVIPTGVGDLTEYVFTATHLPLAVTAGECYWIRIDNMVSPTTCTWLWNTAPPGDGKSAQDTPGGDQVINDFDLAWCLNIDVDALSCPPAFGACCDTSSGVCTDNEEQLDCVGAGNTFTGDTTCGALEPSCDSNLGVVCGIVDPASCQLPDQVGHGAGGIIGSTSDSANGFAVVDNFRATTTRNITEVCWWGFYIDFGGPSDCGPGTGDSFTIKFYDDDGGVPAPIPVQTEIVVAAKAPTGNLIGSGIGDIVEFEYTATLTTPFLTIAGDCHWIEIQNNSTGACVWLWSTAPPGDGISFQDDEGDYVYDPDEEQDFDLAFCVNTDIEPAGCTVFGACCDDISFPGTCTNDVANTDCPLPFRFEEGCTCDMLVPACGAGGCCLSDGTCNDLTEDDCITAGGQYNPGNFCAPPPTGGQDQKPFDGHIELLCNPHDECTWHNGLPDLLSTTSPATQYAPGEFYAEAADDFILKGDGTNLCNLTDITWWSAHFGAAPENGGCNAGTCSDTMDPCDITDPMACGDDPVLCIQDNPDCTNTPADYSSIRVTIYNVDSFGAPDGLPEHVDEPISCTDALECVDAGCGDFSTCVMGECVDEFFDPCTQLVPTGDHIGAVKNELIVPPSSFIWTAVPGTPDLYEITMDMSSLGVQLEKNKRNFLAIAPELPFAGYYQTAWNKSNNSNGVPAGQIFELLGIFPWTQQGVPPFGDDLAFILNAVKDDPCANVDCTMLDDSCAAGVCNPDTRQCEQIVFDSGTVCGPAVNDCDIEETCDGASTTCPVDVCEGEGTVCDAGGESGTCNDSCICVPDTGPCVDFTDCADADDNGITDDNCLFYSCDAGVCSSEERNFGDVGGPFGACAKDGTTDNNDRNHVLNCFSNLDTDQLPPYPCEPAPPTATNADAGGAFGECCPDGVCDGNDAFHTLDAFAGESLCACDVDGGRTFVCPCPTPTQPPDNPVLCPPSPAPDGGAAGPRVVATVDVELIPSARVVRSGDVVEIDVLFKNGVPDIRGYQLHLETLGGLKGRLQLVDIAIHDRRDAVFAGLPTWQAYNVAIEQALVGMDGDGIDTTGRGYLATFTYRATGDAAGRFHVDLRYDRSIEDRTFLFPSNPGNKIAVGASTPATIEVVPRKKLTR